MTYYKLHRAIPIIYGSFALIIMGKWLYSRIFMNIFKINELHIKFIYKIIPMVIYQVIYYYIILFYVILYIYIYIILVNIIYNNCVAFSNKL